MCRNRAQRGLIAWLAFAALGLLMLAPTISRSMAASMPASAMHASTMDASCMGHGASATHPPSHQDPAAPHAGDACGYCSLMSHSPAVATVAIAPLSAVPDSLPVTALLTRRALLLHTLAARPRGPPLG